MQKQYNVYMCAKEAWKEKDTNGRQVTQKVQPKTTKLLATRLGFCFFYFFIFIESFERTEEERRDETGSLMRGKLMRSGPCQLGTVTASKEREEHSEKFLHSFLIFDFIFCT